MGGRSSLVNGDTLGGILEGGARKAVFKELEGGGAGVADEGADLGGETCGSRVGGGDNLEVDDDAAGGHTENRNLVRVDLKCTKDRVLSHLKDLSAGGEPTISVKQTTGLRFGLFGFEDFSAFVHGCRWSFRWSSAVGSSRHQKTLCEPGILSGSSGGWQRPAPGFLKFCQLSQGVTEKMRSDSELATADSFPDVIKILK